MPTKTPSTDLQSRFINVTDALKHVVIDVKYAGTDNFIGDPIDGYLASKVYLTPEAVNALESAETRALNAGYRLKIYDGYRPQRAVDHFIRWANDAADIRQQARFYPTLSKQALFENGYLFEHSSHSRGSTLDLTLVDSQSPDNELDMGTEFDFFDETSHTHNALITAHHAKNRQLLVDIMAASGFINAPVEWWHFTLANEPFTDTYFNWDIC
ncbi:D-alanyl-D-alanine dipeptidase [BD1-7 clade bacterium]|uniref:D-alanyl-D-alanine dipeptidase n=1 Tax=BD1-7 clade bacterium TaxID=2029982 RepID=A0A5S9PNP8_9GAMM|nr:D-alanyl-D-alanine dipeptidase [BD1-7 clade bacterium]CAA0105783.1 D-alanyl-D-alanine dipeptidase [BD1-7 clade bacterium]